MGKDQEERKNANKHLKKPMKMSDGDIFKCPKCGEVKRYYKCANHLNKCMVKNKKGINVGGEGIGDGDEGCDKSEK